RVFGGDVHPQPGPSPTALRCSSTARSVAFELNFSPKNTHANIKIVQLNVRSLKSRENFILVKDSIQSIGFDVFTISETWLDSSVTDASVYIPGYSMFRQDRGPRKAAADFLVNSQTRITESNQSLIDVVMTTNKETVTSSGVLTSSISDHNIIFKGSQSKTFLRVYRELQKAQPHKIPGGSSTRSFS
ncbi:hypothetical protein P5673_020524, partial [Acropora cervicornis]